MLFTFIALPVFIKFFVHFRWIVSKVNLLKCYAYLYRKKFLIIFMQKQEGISSSGCVLKAFAPREWLWIEKLKGHWFPSSIQPKYRLKENLHN